MYFKNTNEIFKKAQTIQGFNEFISGFRQDLWIPEEDDENDTDIDLIYKIATTEIGKKLEKHLKREYKKEYREEYNTKRKKVSSDIDEYVDKAIIGNKNYEKRKSEKDKKRQHNVNKETEQGRQNETDQLYKEKDKIDKKIEKDKIDKKIDSLFKRDRNTLYEDYQKLGIKNNNEVFNANFHKLDDSVVDLSHDHLPQVFLSYAIKDKLLATALHFIFREEKIFLYVDVLFNFSNRNVKEELQYQMEQSGQFLFLDAPNAMITLNSQTYIRPWCFWEQGYFLGLCRHRNGKETYRFGFAKPQGESSKTENLKGYKIFTYLSNQRIG